MKRKAQLRIENANLFQQVELAKQHLIELETANGKKQIAIPGQKKVADQLFKHEASLAAPEAAVVQGTPSGDAKSGPPSDAPKPTKEKKTKKPTAAVVAVEEAPVDIGRLDLRVGKIIEVMKHPDADSLYVEKIECGEARPRTVVSGLVKFIPIEQMQDRMVVILCNLKPAKMRNVVSEAMVMCASSPEAIEILTPPAGSVPGDLVHCEGYTRAPDAQLNPKKKIFETCAPDLKTNDQLAACYKGTPWNVPGKGLILAQTLKSVIVK